jgi:hypothetical protein
LENADELVVGGGGTNIPRTGIFSISLANFLARHIYGWGGDFFISRLANTFVRSMVVLVYGLLSGFESREECC